MHPLLSDLSKLTDTELTEKTNELNKKLMYARRGGSQAVGQLQSILNDYMNEQYMRQEAAFKKIQEEASESGNDWDGIINIG